MRRGSRFSTAPSGGLASSVDSGQRGPMGIRYYAYAFDAELTEQALGDPGSMFPGDPLADAWGMEPGAMIGRPTFKQVTAEGDMLYLDKAWWLLQRATGPAEWGAATRPAYRMFEGAVYPTDNCGWESWTRALIPSDVVDIASDLESIDEEELVGSLRSNGAVAPDGTHDVSYALSYFNRAREFVTGIAASGRGFVYMIG